MTKDKSVNVPKMHKYEPKFSFSVLNKFPELSGWLEEISRFRKVKDFIYISDYKKGEIVLKVYTKNHRYSIVARLPNKEGKGYLGCTAMTRKPRAAEDWNRGNDLADGGYSKETWQEIKDDILAYELVKVVRNAPDKSLGE